MTARQRRQPRQGFLAWLSLLFPLGASLAAQITWAVRTGSVVLGVWGGLATVLLALSIHRWRRLPSGLVRDFAMAGVVLAVGGWTWLHSALLLISELPPEPNRFVHYVSVGLCIAAFLPIEGLAVLSVLALDQRESLDEATAQWGPPSAALPAATEPCERDAEPVTGPDTEPFPPPTARPAARPTPPPAARPTTRPASRPAPAPVTAMKHADGWAEHMALPREVVNGKSEDHTPWLRRRAAACGLPQRTPRLDVERAEVAAHHAREPRGTQVTARATGGVERDSDDERERVSA